MVKGAHLARLSLELTDFHYMDPFHGGYQIYRDTLVYQKEKKRQNCWVYGSKINVLSFSEGDAATSWYASKQRTIMLLLGGTKHNRTHVNSSKTMLQTILIHIYSRFQSNYIQTPHQFLFLPDLLFFTLFSFSRIRFPPRLAETRLHNLRLRGHFPQDREGEAFHLSVDGRTPRSSRTVDFFRFNPFLRLGGKKRYTAAVCVCFLYSLRC